MAKTPFVRLYADANGESHFSDEENGPEIRQFRASGTAR
jgi:hypothetical protein